MQELFARSIFNDSSQYRYTWKLFLSILKGLKKRILKNEKIIERVLFPQIIWKELITSRAFEVPSSPIDNFNFDIIPVGINVKSAESVPEEKVRPITAQRVEERGG